MNKDEKYAVIEWTANSDWYTVLNENESYETAKMIIGITPSGLFRDIITMEQLDRLFIEKE